MPLKNGNGVGLERRMDLASLFCMIGRHGPAVALAVVAVMSVLAGLIIYRSVRGKRRRKATDDAAAAAAAAAGDSESPGEERDADACVASRPGAERPSAGGLRSSPAESTDVSDGGASDVRDDDDLFRRDVKIRHRRAAAEKKPPRHSSPPKSDVQMPDSERIASDGKGAAAVVQDSYKGSERDDADGDSMDTEVRGNDGCSKEPGFIDDEGYEDEDEAFKADDQEDVATDEDVSDQQTGQEEEHFPRASNNRVCFDQTPRMSDNVVGDGRQDNDATPVTNKMESAAEEPVNHIESVPVSCVRYAEDEDFEEESSRLDCIDDRDRFSDHFSPEEEMKNEGKGAEEECVVQQLVPQRDETRPSNSEQEPNLDQCDYVTDRATPPIRGSALDDNGGLAEERIDEDRALKADEVDSRPPQCDEQQLQMEQADVNGVARDREDAVLPAVADREKVPTRDGYVACGDRRDVSSAVLSPTLESVENHEGDLSGIHADTTAHISDIVDFPDLSLDCRRPQGEQRVEEFDGDTDLADLPSVRREHQYERSEVDATAALAEESVDPHLPPRCEDQQVVNREAVDETSVAAAPREAEDVIAPMMAEKRTHPHWLSWAKDQQRMQTTDNEASDECINGAGPDTTETMSASAISEEESCPHLPSIRQDQNKCNATPVTPEEISHPFSQDPQSDQMQNNGDFSEFPVGGSPAVAQYLNPPAWPIHLPSFERSEPRDNVGDTAPSPGVGRESGISSMAVSPDLPRAGSEFGENVADAMQDWDPHWEERAEAQNGLFADDVAAPVIHENTAGWLFGPYPPRPCQQPHGEHTDGAKCDSFAANEDAFGHEIEDGYHRALERLMAHISANATGSTDEPNDRADVTAAVEVVEVAGVRIAKKTATEAGKEKEEDYERTEISIMEATMDNNEWITDNYQVLPWMNLSVPSVSQDLAQTDQLPTGGCQHSSALADADAAPPTEVEQTGALPVVEGNAENNNKKVVAVQPMPQSVNVTFRIHYLTRSPYQTVAVTGNQRELGNWRDFVPLERAKDGHWAAAVSLPAESHVEWKFVLAEKGEVCRWEECGNRLLDTGCGDDLTVHKWWGLL